MGAYLVIMFPWKKVLLTSSLLGVDVGILLVLSVLLMDYDDSYNGPPAEYGAWHTMSPFQRGISISYGLWVCVNVLALVAWVYWLLKERTPRSASN